MVFVTGISWDGRKEKILELQDQGWELAGYCSIKNGLEYNSVTYLQIPLKRLVK